MTSPASLQNIIFGRGSASGGGAGTGNVIMRPGWLSPLVSFTRLNDISGERATATDADGLRRSQYAANSPRWSGPRRLLQIESRRTNQIRNPRAEGAVVGTPGTMPTNWPTFAAVVGLSRSVVRVGTTQGMSYVDIRVQGTATGAGGDAIWFETQNGAATPTGGNPLAASVFLALVGGTTTNLSAIRQRIEGTNGTTRTELLPAVPVDLRALLTSVLQPFEVLLTAAPAASTTHSRYGVEFGFVAGPVDVTLRVAWPMMERAEQSRRPSTTILPDSGSLVPSTRNMEFISGTLAAVGFGAAHRGGFEVVFNIERPEPGQASRRRILQIEGPEPSPATIAVSLEQTTFNLEYQLVDNGVVVALAVLGVVPVGVDTSVRVEIGLTGEISFSVNGGAPIVAPARLANFDLDRFSIGNTTSGNSPMWGMLVSATAFPDPVEGVFVIRPGFSDVLFGRDHTPDGAVATALAADGVTWTPYAENVPRFHAAERHMLIEGARTNTVPNSRGEGAVVGVVGSGGVQPTGWGGAGASTAGLSVEIVSIGTMLGLPSTRIRFFGVATAASITYAFGPAGTTTLARWTGGFNIAMPAAPLPPLTVDIGVVDGGTAVIAGLSATPQRASRAVIMTLTTGRRVICVPRLTIGNSYDFTLDLGVPSFAEDDMLSTPVTAPVGTPGASTRGADVAWVVPSEKGFNPAVDGEIRVGFILDATAQPLDRLVFSLENGANAIKVFVEPTTGFLFYAAVTPGPAPEVDVIAPVAAGVLHTLSIRMTDGRASFTLDEAPTVEAELRVDTVGTSQIEFGNNVARSRPMWGRIVAVQLIPAPIPRGTLLLPGGLLAPGVFARTQSPAGAVASAGAALRLEYAANTPRFVGAAHRLLLEPEAINRVTNPTTPSAGWATFGGVPVPTVTHNMLADLSGAITLSRYLWQGQPAAQPVTVRIPCAGLVAAGNYLVSFDIRAVNKAAFLSLVVDAGDGANSGSLYAQLVTGLTVRVVAPVAVAGVGQFVDVTLFGQIGGATDLDIYIGAAQAEVAVGTAVLASSFVRAPAGPAITRGLDRPTVALAALGIAPGGGFRAKMTGYWHTLNTGATRVLMSFDDGTMANRMAVYQTANTAQIRFIAYEAGGVVAFPTALGNQVAGVPFTVEVLMQADGSGNVALNNTTPQLFSGVPAALLTHARLGHYVDLTGSFGGEVETWSIVPA